MNRSADGLISKNDMPKNFAGNTLNVVTNSMSPGRSFSRSILVEFGFF